MKGNSEKGKVLKLVRNSLLDKADIPYSNIDMDSDIYDPITDDPVMIFAESIVGNGGKFVYCKDEKDMINKLNSLIEYRNWSNKILSYGNALKDYLQANGIHTNQMEEEKAEVGITLCHSASARNSLIIVTSNQVDNEFSKLPNILIIIIFTSQIVTDLRTSLNQLSEDMPKFITTLNPNYLLKEEIKELYLFTVENIIQTN
ncbi:MAG: hypothetical protein PHO12_03420 [Bacteroidales bacterium]|nr:hypothetical protein [Bacteroidales bacterium]MDD4684153.1 hypothetical protein [Bacteroidales bacterium]